jgi:hypothetical protein
MFRILALIADWLIGDWQTIGGQIRRCPEIGATPNQIYFKRIFKKKKRNIQLFYGIPHDYMETPFFVEIMSISACQFPDERLATGATGAKARPRVVSPESGRPSAHTSRSARLPTLALSWPKLKLIVICIIYILYIYIYIRWIYQTQSWFKAFQTFQGHGLLFQHVSVSYILQPSGWAKPDTHVLGDSDLSEFGAFFAAWSRWFNRCWFY